MSIAKIIKKLPEGYAKDIKHNLEAIFKGMEGLSSEQLYGVALTAGYYLKNEQMLNHIRGEAKLHLEESYADACKMAVVLMAMNNTYYRFAHDMVDDAEIKAMQTDLQMEVLHNPGIPLVDFEVLCLAVSILRGCKTCVQIHIKKLQKRGFNKVAIRNIGRVVSVFCAVAEALEIETLRSYDFAARGPSL